MRPSPALAAAALLVYCGGTVNTTVALRRHLALIATAIMLAACGGSPSTSPATPAGAASLAVDTVPADSDLDYISDDIDLCPYEPEDVDNFEDTDGCPDPDFSPW